MTRMRDFRRGRPAARWSEPELAEVVLGVLRGAPDVLWSADDVRERLAFGREGAGPAATSVRARCARWSATGASSAWRSGGAAGGATPPTPSGPPTVGDRRGRGRAWARSPRRRAREGAGARPPGRTRPGAEW